MNRRSFCIFCLRIKLIYSKKLQSQNFFDKKNRKNYLERSIKNDNEFSKLQLNKKTILSLNSISTEINCLHGDEKNLDKLISKCKLNGERM